MGVKQKFLDSLVEDWKEAYKWLSVQSIALITLIGTLKEAFPDEWDQVVSFLPEPLQKLAIPLGGAALIYMRLKNQSKDKGQDNA